MNKIIKGSEADDGSYNKTHTLSTHEGMSIRMEVVEKPILFTEIVGVQRYLIQTNDAEYVQDDVLRYADNSKDIPNRIYFNDEEDEDGSRIYNPLPADFKVHTDAMAIQTVEMFYFRLTSEEVEKVKKIANLVEPMVNRLADECGARGTIYLTVSTKNETLGAARVMVSGDLSCDQGDASYYETPWGLAIDNALTKAGKSASPMTNWLSGVEANFRSFLNALKAKAARKQAQIDDLDKEIQRLQAKKQALAAKKEAK